MPDNLSNRARFLETANGAPLVATVADEVLRIRRNDPFSRVVVVVPSYFSAFFLRRALTDELCVRRGASLFNVEFMRIEEVADRLFDATSTGSEKPSMSRLIASELIYNAIAGLKSTGPISDHAENESTLDAVQHTLRELELLDDGAEDGLLRLTRGSRDGLYAQLLEIHRRYTELAARYSTRENKSSVGARIVHNEPDRVNVYLGSSIIVIRAPSSPDAYTRLWEALARMEASTEIRLEPAKTVRADQSSRIRFYSAMGAADEPRALIRNIIADARNGMKFGDMVVLYPSPNYASRIKDALNGAKILNCGPSHNTLEETASGKFVSLFLAMLDPDAEMRRDTFTAWVTSAPVVEPTSGQRVPAVPWEIVSRNANIARFSGDAEWQRSLASFGRRMLNRANRAEDADADDRSIDPDTLREAANAAFELRRFVTELLTRTNIADNRSWSDWVDWIEGILRDYHSQSEDPETVERTGLERIKLEFDQIRGLSEITSRNVIFRRFSRTVRRLLGASSGGDAGWGSAVLVAPLSASIGTAFASVHILGMAEGALPGPGRSDPLLSDDLRRQLDRDGSWLTTKTENLDHRHREFQLALACAPTKRLYWNKAVVGATHETYPSPWFVDEILKARNESNLPVKSLMNPDSDWVDAVTPLRDIAEPNHNPSSEYEFALQNVAIRSADELALGRFLSKPHNQSLALGRQVMTARSAANFGPYDGQIRDQIAVQTHPLDASASSLQNYAECPYRYFLGNRLNVDERIDPEDSLSLSAQDKGILVHSILERFFGQPRIDKSAMGLETLIEISQKVCDAFQRNEYVGYNAIFELEKTRLIQRLVNWHAENLDVLDGHFGEFRPEYQFGSDNDEYGGLRLGDGTTVKLRGKIDLIAISESRDRAMVIDFKSGNSSRYSDIEKDVTASGTKLQLPIYAIAAAEILGGDVDISAAYWFIFHDTGIRLRPRRPVPLEQARGEFEPVLETIVNGIRNGNFPARPGDRVTHGEGPPWKNCQYCAFSDACTSDRLVAWNRKKIAPELADYVALVEGEGA